MIALKVTWFILIGALLAGYAILDGFDLGVGFWHLFAKKEEERRVMLRSIGPVWDGNEVWLLTGGGALFAAFPPVYAAVFSGFYLALLLLLLGLILRATAIEFRYQASEPRWRASLDRAFSAGSVLAALVLGVAVGNLVRGLELDREGNYVGGFVALLNPYALLTGLTGLAMLAMHGALYLALKSEGELQARARAWASKAWAVYVALFVLCGGWTLAAFQRGSAALAAAASLAALIAIACVGLFNRAGARGKAFAASAVSIAALFGAVGASMFPNLVPAGNDPGLSLTIYNASASQNTLTVMLLLAAVGMPMVIAYTTFIYRLFSGPIKLDGPGHSGD